MTRDQWWARQAKIVIAAVLIGCTAVVLVPEWVLWFLGAWIVVGTVVALFVGYILRINAQSYPAVTPAGQAPSDGEFRQIGSRWEIYRNGRWRGLDD